MKRLKGKKQNTQSITLPEQITPLFIRAGIVFFIGVILGVIFIDLLLPLMQLIKGEFRAILAEPSWLGLVSSIILNNLWSTLLMVLLGVTIIYPYLSILFNGLILGIFALASVREAGILSLLRLVPHGVLELPALILASALGMYVGSYGKGTIKERIRLSVKIFLRAVVPLICAAGFIEGTLIYLLR